jgi:polysaccharide pyruvyl transferase WcaK-like protein
MGVEIGVLTANPAGTAERYPGVKCFDVSRGRLRAVIEGVLWCDIAVVGGGELVQNVSSGLYTPFNLFPLFLAFLFRKKSFAWAVGIGQGKELSFSGRIMTKLALKTTAGVTVRDRGSFNTLHRLGLREPEMILASDCALSLPPVMEGRGNFLGAAPRNVSNRQKHFLPLELRRKLGRYREPDPTGAATAWARLLDWHCGRQNCALILFPFHTGTLSNSDHVFTRLVAEKMKLSERVTFADPDDPNSFMKLLSKCRVMVTTPLHGAILSIVEGAIPVSVSYSSKCTRFMEQAGLSEFISSGKPGIPDNQTAAALKKAWEEFDARMDDMSGKREMLSARAKRTAEHFRRTFAL